MSAKEIREESNIGSWQNLPTSTKKESTKVLYKLIMIK
jgi:hypothetical protein